MKSYVITIVDNNKSVEVANRCIDSGKKFGVNIDLYSAYTPNDDLFSITQFHQIPVDRFKEKYSRFRNCVAAFMSHFTLWLKCRDFNEEFLILEHDAVIVDKIPVNSNYEFVMNLGKPSYGKFRTPSTLGINPLTSKQYFPGAHGYIIKPAGAEKLIQLARRYAAPTDVFMNTIIMPWLQEYYPWPVEARDSFTTIQNVTGCLAKHNYGKNYEIV